MPANTAPIYPIRPAAYSASLVSASACTTRAPTAHATLSGGGTPNFAVALVPVTSDGMRVDTIQVQAASTSISSATVAQTVLIWRSNGTTGVVIDEIQVTAVTPSTTVPAFSVTRSYSNLALASTDTLWVSTTVATTASSTALCVTASGGVY